MEKWPLGGGVNRIGLCWADPPLVTHAFFQLSDELQAGALSATEVLCAYVHFALLAHDRLNCVAEFLPEAFEAARELDAEYAGGERQKPPLFGLPFSVKANFYVSLFLVKLIIKYFQ